MRYFIIAVVSEFKMLIGYLIMDADTYEKRVLREEELIKLLKNNSITLENAAYNPNQTDYNKIIEGTAGALSRYTHVSSKGILDRSFGISVVILDKIEPTDVADKVRINDTLYRTVTHTGVVSILTKSELVKLSLDGVKIANARIVNYNSGKTAIIALGNGFKTGRIEQYNLNTSNNIDKNNKKIRKYFNLNSQYDENAVKEFSKRCEVQPIKWGYNTDNQEKYNAVLEQLGNQVRVMTPSNFVRGILFGVKRQQIFSSETFEQGWSYLQQQEDYRTPIDKIGTVRFNDILTTGENHIGILGYKSNTINSNSDIEQADRYLIFTSGDVYLVHDILFIGSRWKRLTLPNNNDKAIEASQISTDESDYIVAFGTHGLIILKDIYTNTIYNSNITNTPLEELLTMRRLEVNVVSYSELKTKIGFERTLHLFPVIKLAFENIGVQNVAEAILYYSSLSSLDIREENIEDKGHTAELNKEDILVDKNIIDKYYSITDVKVVRNTRDLWNRLKVKYSDPDKESDIISDLDILSMSEVIRLLKNNRIYNTSLFGSIIKTNYFVKIKTGSDFALNFEAIDRDENIAIKYIGYIALKLADNTIDIKLSNSWISREAVQLLNDIIKVHDKQCNKLKISLNEYIIIFNVDELLRMYNLDREKINVTKGKAESYTQVSRLIGNGIELNEAGFIEYWDAGATVKQTNAIKGLAISNETYRGEDKDRLRKRLTVEVYGDFELRQLVKRGNSPGYRDITLVYNSDTIHQVTKHAEWTSMKKVFNAENASLDALKILGKLITIPSKSFRFKYREETYTQSSLMYSDDIDLGDIFKLVYELYNDESKANISSGTALYIPRNKLNYWNYTSITDIINADKISENVIDEFIDYLVDIIPLSPTPFGKTESEYATALAIYILRWLFNGDNEVVITNKLRSKVRAKKLKYKKQLENKNKA